VQYLGINQTEWSVSYPRSSSEQSARIRDYTVARSNDGTSWTTVKTATMPSTRGVQIVDLGISSTRFVRLTVNSTWAASTDSKHYKKLRINDLYVASAYAGAGSPPPPGHFEAEDATLSQATVATNHTGFTGSGFVDYTNVAGSYVQFSVPVTTAGTKTLTFRYSNASGADRPMAISVNGGTPVTVSFPPTVDWNTWATATVSVSLPAGTDTVRATATVAAGGPNLDSLDVS
jgi:alpha-L-fucosidase